MEFLVEYDFGIEYIKGKENKETNALSRHQHVNAIRRSWFNLLEQVKNF